MILHELESALAQQGYRAAGNAQAAAEKVLATPV